MAKQTSHFRELKDGDPLFLLFSGEVIPFKRAEHKVPAAHSQVFGIFINEAAYYENKIALMLLCKAEETISMLTQENMS